MRIEAAFKVFMMLLVVWIMMWAQVAWCVEAPKPRVTLKVTVKEKNNCANGKCSVRQYSMPVQTPACKNGKCNLQQRKVTK